MIAGRLLGYYPQISDTPGAVQRMRQLILNLAIRGRLVPQDPWDESASELVGRISAEKARLVKTGEIKRPRTISMHPTEVPPFTLPATWAWSQLTEIGVLNPRNIGEDNAESSFIPMPLIPVEYGIEATHEVRVWGEIKKQYTHFAEGDVGLAKITPCFENGKSTVFRGLTGGFGSGTTELHIVRPIFVEPTYVLVFLKSSHFIQGGIPKMNGTAGQKRVPTGYFANSPFPLPPLAEQRRIVARVDELMELCDRLETTRGEREATRNGLTTATLARLNNADPDPWVFKDHAYFAIDNLPVLTARRDQIEAIRRTILNLAVRGKLVPQDPDDEPASKLSDRILAERARLVKADEIKKKPPRSQIEEAALLFELPSGWALVRLGQAIELVNGRAFKPSDWTSTGLPIVRIQNLNDPTAPFNRYDGEVKDRFLIDTGDFVISWSGTPGTSFGAHIWERGPAVLNQHIFKSVLIGDAYRAPFLKLAINSRLSQR